jgi:DNA (cytosine-5)-methyltransferase 1
VRYLSVCSGIEAATQAWHPRGWTPVAFSEIEPFPSAVLAHHYPAVPNWGDMTKFRDWPDEPIDLLVGGTPCQSFSVAGLRAGLADPRGNLMLTFGAIAGRYRPKWLVWENVPGVLSSNGGRDFGAFLGMLGELGYGVAYRVLDAQYVRTRRFPRAVPQRRRRVFVVGYLGDWRRAAAVLFDRESLSGHPPPRREAGQGTAPTLAARTRGGGGLGTDFDCDGGLIASTGDVSHCLNAGGMGRIDFESETMVAHALRGEGFDASEDGTGRGTPLVPVAFHPTQDPISSEGVSHAIGANSNATAAVAFAQNVRGEVRIGDVAGALSSGGGKPGQGYPAVAFDPNQVTSKANRSVPRGDVLHTMPATSTPPHLASPWAVRRLTPRECERLQAFPDDFTRIPYRGKPADQCPDGPRYKALGNSMAVNVMDWIGERIAHVETIMKELAA